MTPDELDAVEARAAAVHETPDLILLQRESLAMDLLDSGAVDALIAALREAWAEAERLRNPDLRIVYGYELGAADLEAVEARAEKAEAMGQAVLEAVADLAEANAEVERLRGEATSGPSWDAVALRSALVAMTVERDDLRAAHERLDRDGRAVAGRCLHYETRAEKAEAAIARLEARIHELEAGQ